MTVLGWWCFDPDWSVLPDIVSVLSRCYQNFTCSVLHDIALVSQADITGVPTGVY